jgi:hypothetical protein
MWFLVAAILIVWLIVNVLFPCVLAVLAWIAISALDSPAFLKIESAREKIGALLGKVFPAYMPPRA